MIKTNELIIIGGVSAVGKTTLQNNIRDGKRPNLCKQLNIIDPPSYTYLDGAKLPKISTPQVDKLILHYDFIHNYCPKEKFKFLPHLLRQADTIQVLTVATSVKFLIERMSSRVRTECNRSIFRTFGTTARKLRKRRSFYEGQHNVNSLYEEWSEFIDQWPIRDHFLMDTIEPDTFCIRPYSQEKAIEILANETTGSWTSSRDAVSLRDSETFS
jgi:hypothetical protein